MKIIDVVAAVIIDDDGKILIAKRKKGKTKSVGVAPCHSACLKGA